MNMSQVLAPNSAILEKTRELCSLILQSSEYKENAAKVEAFFKDHAAQASYQKFVALGESMGQKQRGGTLTQTEIDKFNDELEKIEAHPVTGPFMAAEEVLNGILRQVSRHVGKTLELGHLPTPDDLVESGGCCGSGGCGSCD